MRRQRIVGTVVACAAVLVVMAPAKALVSSGDGQVNLSLYDFFNGANDDVDIFPVGFPEAMTRTQTGTPTAGGYNEVIYDVHETLAGALMDVSVVATTAPAGEGGGGRASFSITFTTVQDFDWELRATVERAPSYFEANFNGVIASAQYNQLGELSGTFPTIDDGGGNPIDFDEFVDSGHLPAGTYTFGVKGLSGLGRSGDPLNTSGAATLTLVPEPLTAGMSLLGIVAPTCALRRRRHD